MAETDDLLARIVYLMEIELLLKLPESRGEGIVGIQGILEEWRQSVPQEETNDEA